MEKYLDKCLTSLIIEDCDLMKQLEVLVVIDGAKDRSSEIAHSYEKYYPETFRVIDKENGNYGSCVNRGLQESTGKYIKVLDADDWFDSRAFKPFLELLLSIDCDMVLSSFNRVDESSVVLGTTKWEYKEGDIFSFADLPIRNIEMHAITYKSAILKDVGYFQTEGISYTDTEWSVLPLPYIKTCVTFSPCLYQYLVGRDGQTVNPATFAKNYYQRVKICLRLLEDLKGLSAENQSYNYVRFKLYSFIANDIYRLVLVNDKTFDFSELRRLDDYLKVNEIYFYDKINSMVLSQKFPIRFVRRWRNNHYSSNDFLMKIYLTLSRIKGCKSKRM